MTYRHAEAYRDRKKIRGRTRHLQRLRQLSTTAAPAPLLLHRQHYAYEKLGLHPWHSHHRLPPKQVRQLAAQHLLTTFFKWQTHLAALPEPSYLAIWLVEPDFAHSSAVVAGIRQRIGHYAEVHGEPVLAGPALPTEYQKLPGASRLCWRTHRWEVLHEDDDYPEGWPAYLLRHPHHEYTSPDGRRFLVVQTGWVWIGQLADPARAQPG